MKECDECAGMLVVNGQRHTCGPLTLADVADVLETIQSLVRAPGNMWIPALGEASAPGLSVKCE